MAEDNALNLSLQRLSDIVASAQLFHEFLRKIWTKIQEEFRLLGMSPKDIEAFQPAFRGNTILPIENLRVTLKDQITQMIGHGATGNPLPESLEYWKSQVALLEQQVGLDEEKRKKLIALQREAGNLEKEIFNAQRELQNFDTVLTPRRKQAVEKRFRIYSEYFDLLEEEVKILEELYEPLRASLMDKDEHEKKLTLYIRTSVDIGTWVSRGEELIDQRKAGPFRMRGSLLEETRQHLAKAWEVHDTPKIKAGITHLIQKFRSAGSIKEQLCAEYDLVDLADWLFSVDHIELEYGLRYDGVELQKLSPGTKGIVLLILYLAVDTRDQRPLIVDQPDENLDNESIYKILRSYFRIAKTRRQIILITHNPNLVVNTDADQVIVASATRQPSGLPSISYFSGSLESIKLDPDTGQTIRERVCQLLEGGREAFDMRERKYRFDEYIL